MLKSAWHHVKSRVEPEHEVSTPCYYRAQGKTFITDSVLQSTAGFVTCYLIFFITGSLLLTITANASLGDALFEFASSIGTVGISVGITCTTTNIPTMIVEMCGMILGRLEIFIVLTGLYSAGQLIFGKKKRTANLQVTH
jgi:trk system potassium uptake protein TrkH